MLLMSYPDNSFTISMARRAAPTLCALFCIALGLAVLFGWAFDITTLKTVLPGLVSMKANTALCFVLSGFALLTLANGKARWAGNAVDLRGEMPSPEGEGWVRRNKHSEKSSQYPPHPNLSGAGSIPATALPPSLAVVPEGEGVRVLKSAIFLWAGRLATTAVLMIALATLAEYFLGMSFGIDQWLFRDSDTPDQFFPGRMAREASVSFIVASLALCFGAPTGRFPRLDLPARALAVGTASFGLVAVLAYLLKLEFLVGAFPFTTIALHTAFGFVVLGAGLLVVLQAHEPLTDEDRIVRLATLLLVLAATATGLMSFATIGRQVHDTLAHGLTAALNAHTSQITTNIALRTTRAEIITSRPTLLRHLRLLQSDPSNPEYRAVVQGELDSFLAHGFSGIAVSLASGWEVASAGEFITWPDVEARVNETPETSLLWHGGIYLRHRLPIWDSAGTLGTVLVEQFLPNLAELLLGGNSEWVSQEFLLCSPELPVFRCFPSRFQPLPFVIAPAPRGIQAHLPFLALTEGAGFGDTIDYRGRHVLGAYERLNAHGLVVVLKVDADDIYGPIARSFGVAVFMILMFAAAGALLVRHRVRPLAAALEVRVRERTAELEAARTELADLYENAPDMFLSVEAGSARILRCNETLLKATGYSRKEVVGKTIFDFYLPEAVAEARQSFVTFQERGMIQNVARRVVRKDGSMIDVSLNATAVYDAEGRIHHSRSSWRDISERSRLERELRAKELLRVFLDAASVMMWMTDENYRARMFNGEWLRFSGRSHEEELAVSWNGGRIHPEDRDRCLAAYDSHLKAHTRLAQEYRLKDCHDSYRWIEEVAVPRFDPTGHYEGHVGCCVDVTERREQAERLAAALAEKTVLLQEIHHRVKNNLTVISSLLNLQAGATPDPAIRAALADSQGRVKSMALLHQLLYEKKDFAQVNLGDYLHQLARLALTSADAQRIAVEFDLAPITLDLERAVPCGLLVNELLTNAYKHAFPDGRTGTLRLELHMLEEDGVALLAISDDGIGLPEALTLGQTQSLGLQLIPLLAEQAGGQLKVERGVGTRFELRFRTAS